MEISIEAPTIVTKCTSKTLNVLRDVFTPQ